MLKKPNDTFETSFNVRYKNGKVDQMDVKISAISSKVGLNDMLIGQLKKIKNIFSDMPMRVETGITTVEQFCNIAIENLIKEDERVTDEQKNDRD